MKPRVTAPQAKFHSKAAGYTNWWRHWAQETYLGGYERAGRKNPKWDDAARDALTDFSYRRVFTRPPPANTATNFYDQLKQAVEAGCDDPLLSYLYARQFAKPPASATPETAREYSGWSTAMDQSGYSSLLRFFVALRTSQAWKAAFEKHEKQAPEVNSFRRVAMKHLQTALISEEMPVHVAMDACLELLDVLDRNPKQRQDFFLEAEPVLFERWGDEGVPFLLKGKFYVDYAWDGRGGGWARGVTKEGWKLFEQRLKVAEAALDKAWELDPTLPRTPLVFMALELGQGRGRARMETWFDRAIAFPQDHYDAVNMRLWYLQPRWYGSEEECLEAAREAVESERFNGHVALNLYHTHQSFAEYFKDSRPDYWTEPHVWSDIKACFEKYFKDHPADSDWRHNYIKCAWLCKQWAVVDAEIPKLAWVNYTYFDGKDKFEAMRQEAHEKTAASRR